MKTSTGLLLSVSDDSAIVENNANGFARLVELDVSDFDGACRLLDRGEMASFGFGDLENLADAVAHHPMVGVGRDLHAHDQSFRLLWFAFAGEARSDTR